MPGLRFGFWPVLPVARHPWVQVPAGEIGVLVAQVGAPLPIGAESARYRPSFGDFSDLDTFLDGARRASSARCCLRAPWCPSTPSPSS